MEQTNNIIMFPGVSKLPDGHQKPAMAHKNEANTLDQICDDLMSDILQSLYSKGIIDDNYAETNREEMYLFYETMKSYIYKAQGQYHFLQDTAKTIIELED